MKTITIYTENELHRFAVSEKDIHLTHMACHDKEELAVRRQDPDVSELSIEELDRRYKRTLIRSLCIPMSTVLRPIETEHSLLLDLTDGSQVILFYSAQPCRESLDMLYADIYAAKQTPSSPANPVAVTPCTNDETSDPSLQSVTDAAAATSPNTLMTPTSAIRTNVSV